MYWNLSSRRLAIGTGLGKLKKKKSKENKQKTYGGKIGVCGLCACFFEVEGKRANPGPGGEGVMPSGPAAGPGEHPHGVPSPPRAAQGTWSRSSSMLKGELSLLHYVVPLAKTHDVKPIPKNTLGVRITPSTNLQSGLSPVEWRSDHTAFGNSPGWLRKWHELAKSTRTTRTTRALNPSFFPGRNSRATFRT